MLPGTHRAGIANHHCLIGQKSAHDVRHQSILRPVSAADDVAGARAGQRRRSGSSGSGLGREVGAPVSRGDQLRTALAARIGIVSPHRFVLTVSPGPLAIFVALVTGHVHDGSNVPAASSGLEHVNRSHDVGAVSFHRIGVGTTHQRLCRHVKDHLGAKLRDEAIQSIEIAHVCDNRGHGFGHLRGIEQARFGGRIECVTGHRRTETLHPDGEPATLEAGVAGDEHPFILPERGAQFHVFQGASPLSQASRNRRSSCNVSTHCQYPSCT